MESQSCMRSRRVRLYCRQYSELLLVCIMSVLFCAPYYIYMVSWKTILGSSEALASCAMPPASSERGDL